MGVDAGKLAKVWVEEDEGIAGWVSRHGKPVVVEDVRRDSRFSPRIDEILGFVTRSVVCVPLLDGNNKVIGVIELINKIGAASGDDPEGGSFSLEDMAILAAIGAFAGIGAENAFLHDKIRKMAMIDPLTGISNRLHFNDAFEREVQRVRRYGHSICLLMLDVDDLKKVNDSHGHLMGDQVLMAVAELLRSEVRQSDVVARLGGDEFVILMSQAGVEEGRELARRIEAAIARWNEEAPLDEVWLGLSLGIRAGGPDEMDSILAEADRNLYQMKHSRKGLRELPNEEQVRGFLWDTLATNDDNDW